MAEKFKLGHYPIVSEGERQKLIEAICAHCGNTIQWQKRMPGDGCARGYWFNHATGSGCGKSDFGHERILGAEQPSQTRATDICLTCGHKPHLPRHCSFSVGVMDTGCECSAVPVEDRPAPTPQEKMARMHEQRNADLDLMGAPDKE